MVRTARAAAAVAGLAVIGAYLVHRAGPAGLPGPPGNPRGATLSSRCTGSSRASSSTRRRRPATCRTATRRSTSPSRRRRPACSASRTCRCGSCRWSPRWSASRSWAGWSSGETRERARGHGRRRPAGRDLLRHRHLVRRRPGRLAVPRAQRRRPVRRAVGMRAPEGRSRRACCSAPRSCTKQTGAGGRCRGPRRAGGRAAPAARRAGRAGLRPRSSAAARSRSGWPATAGTCTTSSSR